jgi:hypothetical protein
MTPSFGEQDSQKNPRRRSLGLLAAGAAAAVMLLAPARASAQSTDNAKPDGKGTVGGALLGAEVVDLTLGIVGVNAGWPYLVFGGLGAVGGGIGGFFVEKNTAGVPEVDLGMLAGGLALVIPTLVVSLNATMFKPPETTATPASEPANNQPAVGPAPVQPPAASPGSPTTRRPLLLRLEQKQRYAFSLVNAYRGSFSLGVPALQLKPLYTQREMWTYGVQQGTEVRVPLFYATF